MELLGCGNRSVLPDDDDDFHHVISVVQNDNAASSSSFTALLELPPNQAVQLLHSPLGPVTALDLHGCDGGGGLVFSPPDGGLIELAARFSVFGGNNSPETTGSVPSSNSSANLGMPTIKYEPREAESHDININCSSNNQSGPLVSDPTVENGSRPNQRQTKRKERGKKVNNQGSKKKSKSGGVKESSEEGEKLPFVHVRAPRGQATDSHSLAERARREKINARMKLLQELVPGCSKISGTALVLDEIINHVQSLQREVEFLSMRLAAVNQRIDFNLDSLLAAENGSLVEGKFSSMIMPLMWQEVQYNGNRQHYQQQWPLYPLHQPAWVHEEDSPNFITPGNSLLSYDSSGNSVSLHSNQVKMEL